MATRRVFDAFLGPDSGERTFYHGHSYGGNALAAAVALRHLQLLDEWDLLANVRARSAQLQELLEERVYELDAVEEIRLWGLMGGVELGLPAPSLRGARRVCSVAVGRGVLLRPLGDVVVLMPPLTVTPQEIEQIVDALVAGIIDVMT